MPLVIDDTVGGPNANSYASVTDVDAVAPFRGALGTAWAALSADQKATALTQATDRLDQLMYVGARATDTQARLWPRVEATNVFGITAPTDAIPADITKADISLALTYGAAIGKGTDAISAAPQRDVKRVTAGPVDVEFFAPSRGGLDPSAPNAVGDLPPDVVRFLAPWMLPDVADAPYWGNAPALRAS